MQRDIHLSTLYALYVHLKKSLKYVEMVQDKFRRVASSMSDFSFLCFSTFPCFSGTSMASASLSPGLGQSPPQAPPFCWSSQLHRHQGLPAPEAAHPHFALPGPPSSRPPASRPPLPWGNPGSSSGLTSSPLPPGEPLLALPPLPMVGSGPRLVLSTARLSLRLRGFCGLAGKTPRC